MHRAVPEVLLGLTAAMLAPTSTCAYATADAGGSFNVVFAVPDHAAGALGARPREPEPSIGVPPRLAATPLTVDRGLSVCPGRGCEGRAERDLALIGLPASAQMWAHFRREDRDVASTPSGAATDL